VWRYLPGLKPEFVKLKDSPELKPNFWLKIEKFPGINICFFGLKSKCFPEFKNPKFVKPKTTYNI
jgi:hypothetical protein